MEPGFLTQTFTRMQMLTVSLPNIALLWIPVTLVQALSPPPKAGLWAHSVDRNWGSGAPNHRVAAPAAELQTDREVMSTRK